DGIVDVRLVDSPVLVAIMSAARSLADSAIDCTLSTPDSAVDLMLSIVEGASVLRPVVGSVVPYSSQRLRFALRRAITAPVTPTAVPAASRPPMSIGQRFPVIALSLLPNFVFLRSCDLPLLAILPACRAR